MGSWTDCPIRGCLPAHPVDRGFLAMRYWLALGSIVLSIYFIITDNDDEAVPVWIKWALLFVVPILVIQA